MDIEYKIVGASKQSTCDCCDKKDLQVTVVVSVRKKAAIPQCTGAEINRVRFGTTCAARVVSSAPAPGQRKVTSATVERVARLIDPRPLHKQD